VLVWYGSLTATLWPVAAGKVEVLVNAAAHKCTLTFSLDTIAMLHASHSCIDLFSGDLTKDAGCITVREAVQTHSSALIVSALCSKQLLAFSAYLGCLGCKLHQPEHGSGYSHLLELLRIQKHTRSPVEGFSKVRPQGRWSTAVSSYTPRRRKAVTALPATGACRSFEQHKMRWQQKCEKLMTLTQGRNGLAHGDWKQLRRMYIYTR